MFPSCFPFSFLLSIPFPRLPLQLCTHNFRKTPPPLQLTSLQCSLTLYIFLLLFIYFPLVNCPTKPSWMPNFFFMILRSYSHLLLLLFRKKFKQTCIHSGVLDHKTGKWTEKLSFLMIRLLCKRFQGCINFVIQSSLLFQCSW